MRRAGLGWVAAVALVATSVGWWSPAAAASVAPADEAAFAARLDEARRSLGLPRLAVAADLVAIARRHSSVMAQEGAVSHNANLPSEVEGWELLGENVGTGPSVEEIHQAFMDSEVHREEILKAGFTQVGVGVVHEGGALWVTQVFRRPVETSSSPASTAPAPARAPSRPTAARAARPAAPRASPTPARTALTRAVTTTTPAVTTETTSTPSTPPLSSPTTEAAPATPAPPVVATVRSSPGEDSTVGALGLLAAALLLVVAAACKRTASAAHRRRLGGWAGGSPAV